MLLEPPVLFVFENTDLQRPKDVKMPCFKLLQYMAMTKSPRMAFNIVGKKWNPKLTKLGKFCQRLGKLSHHINILSIL